MLPGPREFFVSTLPRTVCRVGATRWLALVLTILPLGAQTITPSGYTISGSTPPQGTANGGTYNYFDDGGTQLTDGIRGVNDWTADLGHGNAQEWVAWLTTDPSITFTFSSTVSIQSVKLGLARAELNGGIYLPSSVTIGSQTFSLTGNEFADTTRFDMLFTLSTPFVGNALTLTLSDTNTSRWIFLDEVQFTAVPEPNAAWLVALAGGAGLWLRRRGVTAPV